MTHTPMTPEMWAEAMKYPERYCITYEGKIVDGSIDKIEAINIGQYRYRIYSDVYAVGQHPSLSDGSSSFFPNGFRITRRPDAPPMVSQAAELGSALVSPTPEQKKSSDFQMPITKAGVKGLAECFTFLGNRYYTMYSEDALRDRLAELVPHYYIAEMPLDGALISLRLEVLGGNRIYDCITDDRKTGIMYILLKVLEDAK